MIKRNNQQEDAKQIEHIYNVGDKVLCTNDGQRQAKLGRELWAGLYQIRAVNDHGTVTLDCPCPQNNDPNALQMPLPRLEAV